MINSSMQYPDNIDLYGLPNFYNFYNRINEVSEAESFKLRQARQAGKAGSTKGLLGYKDSNIIPKHSDIANRLISASQLMSKLEFAEPSSIMCIQGSPGQGKTDIVRACARSRAISLGLKFSENKELFSNIVTDYSTNKEFFSRLKRVASIFYNSSGEEVRKINSMVAENADHILALLEILIRKQENQEVKSFMSEYILSKYYVFSELTPNDEREILSGLPSLLATVNPIDGTTDTYKFTVNAAKWVPMFIYGIKGQIFLDEITRFDAFQLTNLIAFFTSTDSKLRREMGSRRLSEELSITCAGNFGGGGTAELPEALRDRINFVDLNTTPDDYLNYFKKKFGVLTDPTNEDFRIATKWSEYFRTRMDVSSQEYYDMQSEIKELERHVEGDKKTIIDGHVYTVDDIIPEVYKEAARDAFFKFKFLITTEPQLFMEDKEYYFDDQEEETSDTALTRLGVAKIKKNEPYRIDTNDPNHLQRRSDSSDPDRPADIGRKSRRIESQNRLLTYAFQSHFIPLEYVQILQEMRPDVYSGLETGYMKFSQHHFKTLKDYGSNSWGQAINDLILGNTYTVSTFRNLVSRRYKTIPPEKRDLLFGATEEEDTHSSYLSNDEGDTLAMKRDLGTLDYEEFINAYNAESTITINSPVMVDFAIMINSLKHVSGENRIDDTTKTKFNRTLQKIKGTQDGSISKYVKFILDYAIDYRPIDAEFLFEKLMQLTSMNGVSMEDRQLLQQFFKQLQSRHNKISSADIAAYELDMPKPERKNKEETTLVPPDKLKKLKAHIEKP